MTIFKLPLDKHGDHGNKETSIGLCIENDVSHSRDCKHN